MLAKTMVVQAILKQNEKSYTWETKKTPLIMFHFNIMFNIKIE